MYKIIEKKLKTLFEENSIAGLSVAITDKDGIVARYNFGCESIERPNVFVDEKTLYRIASVSKIFTGITLMNIVEKGLASLDVPIKNYVEWVQNEKQQHLVTTMYSILRSFLTKKGSIR